MRHYQRACGMRGLLRQMAQPRGRPLAGARAPATMPRSTRCNLLRVAAMSPLLGMELDAAGAPLASVKFVAWGKGATDQLARYVLLCEAVRRLGKWPTTRALWRLLESEKDEPENEL